METAIWTISIIAGVVILAIYIITSVGSYSNSFVKKFRKKDDEGLD
ncbi:MAG: hypothetical protein K1X85_11185 [Ignavibacteria bacterium]|nr:hypothetical protein [Ignavibacteria bacterium]